MDEIPQILESVDQSVALGQLLRSIESPLNIIESATFVPQILDLSSFGFQAL